MKKLIIGFISVLIVLGFGVYFLSKKSSEQKNVLLIGTAGDFAPFAFIKDQELVGFDIDIAKEVAKRIGKNAQFVNRDFDMLLPEIQLGNVHMIAAGLTATEDRAKIVNFTKPYICGDPLVVITPKDGIVVEKLEDIFGKKVIVNDGYTADLYLSKISGPELIKLPSVTDAFLALKTNRADAFVTAFNTVQPSLKHYGENAYNIFKLPGTDENCALAISKDFPELLKDVQAGLDDMVADGTVEKLKIKWGIKHD